MSSSIIINDLLNTWEAFQKTGQIERTSFARQFAAVQKLDLTERLVKTPKFQQYLYIWGLLFEYQDISRTIYKNLSPEVAENFLDQLVDALSRRNDLPFPRIQTWISEILFFFKQSIWLQKVADANRVEKWFEVFLSLIRTGNFNVGILLRTWSIHYLDDVAFRWMRGGYINHMNWGEMWVRIRRIGKALLAYFANTHNTPRVAIISENRLEMALVDLACLAFGVVDVMIPANALPQDMAYMIEDSGITVLFITDESRLNQLLPHLPGIKNLKKIIVFDPLTQDNKGDTISYKAFLQHPGSRTEIKLDLVLEKTAVSDLATIMYTSGTTGVPKGIMFSQLNIISKRFARALAWPMLGDQDIFLSYLPLYHTFGRWLEMMGSLFWGSTYIFAQSPNINSLLKEMQTHHPSVFISIPQKWQQIYDYIGSKIDLERAGTKQIGELLHYYTGGNLQLGLSAAGYLDPDIFRFFRQNQVNLMSGFGMTEATGGITMTPPEKYKENSLGKALPGIDLKLAEDGELLLRGPYVMMDYWNTPKEENSFDEAGWLHSGDLMQQDRDDFFYIIDRKKEIYKNIKGQTIAPQRVENLFRDIEAVKRVFLVGDQKEYNTLLIYPNYEYSEINLSDMLPSELHEFFQSIVVSVNQFLAPFERIVQFAVIERDFNPEMGELTPKNTYRRKVIEENFSDVIDNMYQAKFVRLNFRQFVLFFPKWLLRELGILASEVKIDESNQLKIQGKPVLELQEDAHHAKQLRIGNLWYCVAKKEVDLGEILSNPLLWLTNQQLVNLTREKVFSWKRHQEIGSNVDCCWQRPVFKKTKDLRGNDLRLLQQSHVHNLRGLHYSGILLQLGDIKQASLALDYLDEILQIPTDILQHYAKRIIRQSAINPSLEVKQRAFLSLIEIASNDEWLKLFKHFLKADASFLDSYISEKLCEEHIPDKVFERLLHFAEEITILSLNKNKKSIPLVVRNLFLFLQLYASSHPVQYKNVRQFFTIFRIGLNHHPLAELAKNSLVQIEIAFRNWLGVNSPMAVDPDLGQEYSWKQVVVFDDNVPEEDSRLLFRLCSETPFIREALFLFTSNVVVNLKDLPLGGIWITRVELSQGKSVYRISVQTRYQGRHEIIANIDQAAPQEELLREISWMITCSARKDLPQIAEDFGGYWPDFKSWSGEFVQGETVFQFHRRLTRQESKDQNERLKSLWSFIIWSACKAYIDFWNRTGQHEICEPFPENFIVPHHDYQTGSYIVSLSQREPIHLLLKVIIKFYEGFVKTIEDEYRFLKNEKIWQFIFSPVIEILGEKPGLDSLNKISKNAIPASYQKSLGVELTRYTRGVRKRGFIPKRVYFAIQRYKRWKSLNPEATPEAEASTLYELYRTYQLQILEENYPETRVRFFRETVFKHAEETLQDQLDQLIHLLRSKQNNQDEIVRFIANLQTGVQLDEHDKYLLTRMGYKHLHPSDEAELIALETGEKSESTLVVSFLDKEGEHIQVRSPLNPKEVARLHRMFHKFNLPVSFQPKDKFLLAFNQREQLVGGLFYYVQDNEMVHLEKIVVADHYRRKGVSGGILNEFFKRLIAMNFIRVKTGFFRPEFFYRFGFQINRGYAGLVKNLVEEG